MIENNDKDKMISIDSKAPALDDHLRKMFVGGLSSITTEDSLRNFYSQWGDVLDAVVMRDPNTKRSRGFGFVTYRDSGMVDKAQASRPHIIDGKAVDSKRALPRPELAKTDTNASVKKIFVGGLKENHDEMTLSNYFSQFGNVVNVKILADKNTGRKRGFAFVEFDDYDAVDKAVLQKNHTIKYVLVDVKKSVYKQEFAKKMGQHNPNTMQMQPHMAANGNLVSYPQAPGTYNTQPQYGYSTQATTAIPSYNGWTTGYAPYPATAMAGYGTYNTATPQGTTGWNATTYAAAPTWNQNGYTVQPNVVASTQSVNVPPSGWTPQNGGQPFGDYQQTYNGGPQKAGNLQGNRVNPYNVATVANYGQDPVHGYNLKPFPQTTMAAGGHYNVLKNIKTNY